MHQKGLITYTTIKSIIYCYRSAIPGACRGSRGGAPSCMCVGSPRPRPTVASSPIKPWVRATGGGGEACRPGFLKGNIEQHEHEA